MTLRALLEKIRSQDAGTKGHAVVPLEEFFEGNDDPASIGCNLIEHPGPQAFYRMLKKIRDRPEVKTVLVGITEVMGDDDWPFSDCVFVVAKADAAQVEEWAEGLQAEPVEEGWMGMRPAAAPPDMAGYKAFTVWWD